MSKTAYMIEPAEDGDNTSLWKLDPPFLEHDEVLVHEQDGWVKVYTNQENPELLFARNDCELGALEALFRMGDYKIATETHRISIARPGEGPGHWEVFRYDEESVGLAILRWYDISGVGNQEAARALRIIADGIEKLA